MQANEIATPSCAPRHASYGACSIFRSTSHTSTEDIVRETQGSSKEKEYEKGGHCRFMSGVICKKCPENLHSANAIMAW